ncbi:FIST N-terminal domain-containing protein [Limnohabitans sp. Rim8]|uniref:FIST signal transduction protein n=1 Tax=Limnohabitans sp. Rim8 TaxID=1100718 RepID=UPI00330627DF
MSLFPYGHATHPQWPMAAGLVLAQLRAQMTLSGYASAPRLGLLYITDHYAPQAQAILDHLRQELPQVQDWSGTVGLGIAVNNAEYFDEPAMALMLCDVPANQYRVFSGVAPWPSDFQVQAALVHAGGQTPDITELIAELAERTASAYLFGGLASSRQHTVQFAQSHLTQSVANQRGVFQGGLSGVAFGPQVALVSRVTQGCRPISAERVVTEAEGHVMYQLDGQPALQVLLDDLKVSLAKPQHALQAVRSTLAGISSAVGAGVGKTGSFGEDVVVRHIVGLDPARQGVAIADHLKVGEKITFCQRNAQAAKADLMRICAEIREALEPEMLSLDMAHDFAASDAQAAPHPARRMAGAVYVSCTGRGGPHFGGPSAEMQIIRHALGDVPLVGFFAGGEIARNRLYGYTGVLTVFTTQGD